MNNDTTSGETTVPSPDEAFKLLGNATRIEILEVLGRADAPLPFTDLRDRVGIRRGGRFNYHLDRLVGHFVAKTDDGYDLRPPGRRVVQAVLSGAVTEASGFDRTAIDASCQLCGAPIEIAFADGRIETFCTDCQGMWGPEEGGRSGRLGTLLLPPAGIRNRSPTEIYRVAWIWTQLTLLAIACGICPKCSGRLDQTVTVCEQHEDDAGICSACSRRRAAILGSECPTCLAEFSGTVPISFTIHTLLLDTMTNHGLNPINPDSIATVQRFYSNYEEEILSTDPFRGRFTFTIDNESLSLTVDDDLSIVDVETESADAT